jgi:serine/threonine protein kinase
MTPERWKRICELFDHACELAPPEADEYLREQCAGDGSLLSHLLVMLEESRRSGTLDHPPPWGLVLGSTEAPAFSPGQLIAGRYRIVRYINRGGMGEVYEAEHPLLPDHVALKTLLPAIASDAIMIERFKQETQLARSISHRNVCKLFDLEWHPHNGAIEGAVFFLTMELLEGETLSDHIRRKGAMPAAEAFPLLSQMSEALHAAHHAGVIHRDFKPSNVMLVPVAEGTRVVVTDFGLARKASTAGDTASSLNNQVAGTLDYMAPELLTGSQASFQSDIYALGAVAYEMVTGTLPFHGEPPLAAALLRAQRPIPSPRSVASDLDARWANAILRALHPDPGRRFAEVREFPKALRGDPVTVSLPALTRRRALVAACTAAALAGGGLAWRNWLHTRNLPGPEAAALYRQGVADIRAGAYYAATEALARAVSLAPNFSPARARLAESWLELDLPEKALREFLPIGRQDKSSMPITDQLLISAVDLTITREFDQAVLKYEEMRKLAGAAAGDLDIDLGRAYEKANKSDLAMQSYLRAAKAPLHSAAAWLRLGVLYSIRNAVKESDAAFAEADRAYRQISNSEGTTELLLQQGVAANRAHRYPESADLLRRAIDHAHETGNLQQEISARLYLANTLYAAGDADAAQSLASQALATAQTHQMEELTIRGLYNLGAAYVRKGEYAGAEKYFQDGLALAQRTGAWRRAAFCQLHLASLYDSLDRPDAQIGAAKAALAYFQPNRWANETFQGLDLVGRGELHQQRFDAALVSFQNLLDEATKAHNRDFIASAEEDLGSLMSTQENYPQALVHYGELLKSGPQGINAGYAFLHYAITLAVLGRAPEASTWFAKAQDVAAKFPALQLILIRDRAEMALTLNQYRDVIAAVGSATVKGADLNTRDNITFSRLLGLALLRSGNRQAGLRKYREGFTAAQKLNAGEALNSRLALMEALLAMHDVAGALGVFHDVEPALAAYPESRWRALALMARSDRQFAARADEALGQLDSLWGHQALLVYRKRPDIQQICPLLAANSAYH